MIEERTTSPASAAAATAEHVRRLSVLEPGWLDGEGAAPPAPWLETKAVELAAEVAAGLPPPYVYPTPRGGILLEWEVGPWAVSAEAAPGGASYALGATYLGEAHPGVGAFDLDAPGLSAAELRLSLAALDGARALLGAAYAPRARS